MEGDPDEQELQAALLMSLQPAAEARRSKPHDGQPAPEILDADARARGAERELRAAAAEQRMRAFCGGAQEKATATRAAPAALGDALSLDDSEKLFFMVFGSSVSKEIVAQWCHQGFRFSSDSETSLGLVQREGGPCGVLAPVQAMVLKYLLFENQEGPEMPSNPRASGSSRVDNNDLSKWSDCALVFSDLQRTRALLSAFADILWLIGGRRKAVVAVLDVGMLTSGGELNNRMKNVGTLMSGEDGRAEQQDEMISEKLEGIALNSAMDLHQNLRICTFTTTSSLLHQLSNSLPVFRSRVGALLFLFSALLSRGLEAIQSDRDDPGQPLVTAPFGHASQEIVNLLICGHAVPEVFDGNMDVGGGMTVKGIPGKVEVGFLTLLEAFKYCTVGQFLKRPRLPIWVIGSESHYTVLFALQSNIQDENELEDRERRVRHAFDVHDQSGGGGFIAASSIQQILRDMNIAMPREMLENLCSNEFVVWNEFLQAIHQIEKSKGGLKNTDAAGGSKQFDLYHFNGIAKTVGNSSSVQQRPQLTKLKVSVPPKWTPQEYMMDCKPSTSDQVSDAASSMDSNAEKPKEEPVQHAPIVDCIRTRWERASCNWAGDSPSIV